MINYALGFSVSNLGPKRFQRILNEFEDLEKGWNGTKEEFAKLEIIGKTFEAFDKFRQTFDHVRYTGQLEKADVTFISFLNKKYPKRLKKIENPPIGLFCKGNLELLRGSGIRHSGKETTPESDPGQARITKLDSGSEAGMTNDEIASSQAPCNNILKIAVVGTRKATEYGKDATEFLVSELTSNDVCIISGLALGIDGIAHRTTVSQKGKAIAVLGCGVDCCLPSENYSLYRSILDNDGLIISEYPLSLPPNKGTFLARNRIIAALSDGVLVTEAAVGSGSLVTAEYGFSYGKKVFAVPGRINSQMAKGSLSLIKKGAVMVQEGEDILREFKMQNAKYKIEIQKFKNLNKDEMSVVSLLQSDDLTVDELVKVSKLPISQLFGLISGLELKGIIKNKGGKIGIQI